MKTKVYFNNSCSICRTEINEYKKHSKDRIEWVDISTYKNSESETDKKTDELYRRMHVLENGKIISGAESFLIIWKQIPKYNFLCEPMLGKRNLYNNFFIMSYLYWIF